MALNQISLKSNFVSGLLWSAAMVLVLLSVAGQLMVLRGYNIDQRFVMMFNVGQEHNVPTFFSALILLFSSLLLGLITILEKNSKSSQTVYWAVLSIGFLFMTADEQFCIHERLTDPVQKLLGGGHLGIFHYAWVIPGILFVLILAFFFFRFLLQLPYKTRLILLAAGMIYLSGCIGFELIGGYYVEVHQGHKDLTGILIETSEESLEMAGVIIFIGGLLKYIAAHYTTVIVRFDGAGEKE